jgi:hypothetical protein
MLNKSEAKTSTNTQEQYIVEIDRLSNKLIRIENLVQGLQIISGGLCEYAIKDCRLSRIIGAVIGISDALESAVTEGRP